MRRLRAMGIRDKPIAPSSPWQNGFAERLIGSIRRECVDHIVVLGETHLRRILRSYARYYNKTRTHRSLDKDAPISRPVQRTGGIISHALLGGLHHHCVESEFSVHRSTADPRRTAQAWHRCRADHRGKIHGEEKAATVAGLEDLSAQSCRRHCVDGFVRSADDLVSAVVWISDP